MCVGKSPVESSSVEVEESSSNTEEDSTVVSDVQEEDTLSEEEYKGSCQMYEYREIARYPTQYAGKPSYFRGEVSQVMEDGKNIALLVNVTESDWGWDDSMFVTYTRKSSEEARVLEDDVIEIWGDLGELYTYETVIGDTRSIPRIDAEYINILGIDSQSDESSYVDSNVDYGIDFDDGSVDSQVIPLEFSEDEAFDLLAQVVPLSEGQGFMSLGTKIIDIYECYAFSLYEDTPDHYATLGYYVVDPYGYVYEEDIVTGEYTQIG